MVIQERDREALPKYKRCCPTGQTVKQTEILLISR